MFTAKDYAMPQSLEEAYEALMARKTNHIVAGCAWLRMGNKRINTAVDLSDVGLDYIRDTGDTIEIGAMTTYRSVETSSLLQENFGGMLSRAVAPIIGVQFRNVVTVGGSVYARFGFSDFLTPLMILDTKVKLYKEGLVSLADFMAMPYKKDILEKLIIQKVPMSASYQMFRNAEADFPIVNLAVSKTDGHYKVAVGARPQKAVCAPKTAAYLDSALGGRVEGTSVTAGGTGDASAAVLGADGLEEIAAHAGEILLSEVSFGSNMRASGAYRAKIAKVLLKRGLKEVEGC